MAGNDTAQRSGLGASRSRVLDALLASEDPVGVSLLADRLGLHPNTVRFHLDALIDAGLAARTEEHGRHPGRPRVLYRATPDGAGAGQRSYRLLAEILSAHLAAHDPSPADTARAAGREWGHSLVRRPAPFERIGADDAIRRLVDATGEIGFAPQIVSTGRGTRLRLTHCPFREIAETTGEVVCSIHAGLMQGLLAELGAPIEAHRLEPFAEPAACIVYLRARRTTAPQRPGHRR